MRQSSTLALIDVVTPIKFVPPSQSASDIDDWRMALQQGIGERRKVLRNAHRLERTELLQKLRIDAESAWIGLANVRSSTQLIPCLNPMPGADIDHHRCQGHALASSSILHVRADHVSREFAFWLGSETLCALKRLVSLSFPQVPELGKTAP